jgi:recombinational DNA repair protein (RecF pathway)
VARWFESGLADAMGVRPELDRCVECDRALEETDAFRWVPALGGVLGPDHPPPPAESMKLSLDALKLLKAYRRFDVEAIAALRVPPDVETEVESHMRRYTRFILEREARSLSFVDEVRHTDG